MRNISSRNLAKSHLRSLAVSQNRRIAVSQSRKIAESQERLASSGEALSQYRTQGPRIPGKPIRARPQITYITGTKDREFPIQIVLNCRFVLRCHSIHTIHMQMFYILIDSCKYFLQLFKLIFSREMPPKIFIMP